MPLLVGWSPFRLGDAKGASDSVDTSIIVADNSTVAVEKLVIKPASKPPVMRGINIFLKIEILILVHQNQIFFLNY